MKLNKYPHKAQILVTEDNIDLLHKYREVFNGSQFHGAPIVGRYIKFNTNTDSLHAERMPSKTKGIPIISTEEFTAYVKMGVKEKLKHFKI